MISTTLGEICDRSNGMIQTGPFGSQLHRSDYRNDGVPVVMPQDIVGNRISDQKIAYIDETMARKLGRHLLTKGDIVFPRRGEINKRAIIEDNQEGFFCGTGCLKISVPPVEVLPRWLFYYLGMEHIVKWIEGKAVGATMLNLNTGILRAVPIEYPPLDDQQRIVACLATYDDLIATNQRRIALLEDATRRLYREWFVHLRFPGHEQVEVKDGVPEGWHIQSLASVAAINARSIGARDKPDALLYIDISSVSTGLIGTVTPYLFAEAPGRARRRVVHGDVIWSCVRPNRRSYALIWEPDEKLVASTGFAVISATAVPFSYLYFTTTTDAFVGHLEQNATGAAYPAVTAKVFEEAEILVPDAVALAAFDAVVLPQLEQMEMLKQQNTKLVQARDLLLPKLMSGQLDVSGIRLPEESTA